VVGEGVHDVRVFIPAFLLTTQIHRTRCLTFLLRTLLSFSSTQKDVSAVSKHKIRPIRYTNGASGWRWRGHSSEFRGRGIRLPELLRNVRERKVKAEEEVRKAVELKLKDEEAATLA
jgi:hypothetical protein